jgi:hypothetical protein
LGIADILRKHDDRRARGGDPRVSAIERGLKSRAVFSESVSSQIITAIMHLRDPALGEPVRLPIAGKSTETGIYIECQGMVRLTAHCVVRADNNGIAYCSPIDLAMSRGGRIVRGVFEPIRGNAGLRTNKLGVTEKQFAIEEPKLLRTIEALAHQL